MDSMPSVHRTANGARDRFTQVDRVPMARSHEMTTGSLTAEDGGIKNPGNFFRPRSPPGADPSRWRMAKPPDHDSPASGVSRRTFLKTAGVGAAATSLIGAAPA